MPSPTARPSKTPGSSRSRRTQASCAPRCSSLSALYNHVADIGALCNDVGFGLAQAWALDLREQLLRLNRETTGHRLLRGGVILGGAHVRVLPRPASWPRRASASSSWSASPPRAHS